MTQGLARAPKCAAPPCQCPQQPLSSWNLAHEVLLSGEGLSRTENSL